MRLRAWITLAVNCSPAYADRSVHCAVSDTGKCWKRIWIQRAVYNTIYYYEPSACRLFQNLIFPRLDFYENGFVGFLVFCFNQFWWDPESKKINLADASEYKFVFEILIAPSSMDRVISRWARRIYRSKSLGIYRQIHQIKMFSSI